MIGQKLNEKCQRDMKITRSEKNYYWQKRQESIANYRKVVGQNFYGIKKGEKQ